MLTEEGISQAIRTLHNNVNPIYPISVEDARGICGVWRTLAELQNPVCPTSSRALPARGACVARSSDPPKRGKALPFDLAPARDQRKQLAPAGPELSPYLPRYDRKIR